MNCRKWEEVLFSIPALRSELEKVIEARLHCDTGPRNEEWKTLSRSYIGLVANPYFVLVDPTTKKMVRSYDPSDMDPEHLIRFLKGEE